MYISRLSLLGGHIVRQVIGPSVNKITIQKLNINLVKNIHSSIGVTSKQTLQQCTRLNSIYKSNFKCFSTLQKNPKLTGFNVPRIHALTVRNLGGKADKELQRTVLIYISAVGIFMLGMSYAGVPLYRMFCQATGLGGQATAGHDNSKVETMAAIEDRQIKIRFNADTASSMRWNFKPQQLSVVVAPGETALAFYTATNPTAKPIVGISTYNVLPFEAGIYFNKIQCFCFEEQRLNPHEQVDMPVFFYIDPEFAEDPKMENVDSITLSYTFFEAKEGFQVPLPGYMQPQSAPAAT
ncbi:unnamed protein product [Owenia fusiformis]|uniref:Cytochrome c oxidase assembly protein COX11, mitochondrial n=1 Tax=Owenia fusiformis TaxID=6347 RepID=A0A8J1XX86_OWEFU|nr:unnamed protein product [Owenia fusiformis]